jgi:hypothetical protein
MDPSRPTFFLGVEGTPTNNISDVERCPHPMLEDNAVALSFIKPF